MLVGWTHGHVDIFKNQPGRDASGAVGGLDQIVAGLATMFPPKCIDEQKRLGKLAGFDQEARAINFPCGGCFSHVHHPSGGGRMKRRFRFATADFDFCSLQLSLVAGGVVNFLLAENVIEDEDESTRAMGRGQLPKFGAVEENAQAEFVRWIGSEKISGED